jgi:hypothetical protein
LPGLHLLRELLRLGDVDRLVRILDERQHVAHAEDAGGHPLGMERLETVDLLRNAGELDRRAGDVAHRERGPAARVAVELGEHDAGERQCLAKRARRVDGILPCIASTMNSVSTGLTAAWSSAISRIIVRRSQDAPPCRRARRRDNAASPSRPQRSRSRPAPRRRWTERLDAHLLGECGELLDRRGR